MLPELAVVLATKARQTGVVVALNQVRETLTLDRLDVLLRGPYADELATLTVGRLWQPPPSDPMLPRHDESIEDAVMRVFAGLPGKQLSSGFFVRHLGLERWTAQSLLAELADRGLLDREGNTSDTKYRLAGSDLRAESEG